MVVTRSSGGTIGARSALVARNVLLAILAFAAFRAWAVTAAAQTPSDDLTSLLPRDGVPEGWSAPEPARVFEGQALYRHINGGAEVFHERGFLRLAVRYYKSGPREVSVELYEMQADSGAAAVIKANSIGAETNATFGEASLVSDLQILFRRGRHYAAVTTFETSPESAAALTALAHELDARLAGKTVANPGAKKPMLTLTSPSFESQKEIAMRHTCEGPDLSPALRWGGLPPGSKSLALIVDDPDAPDPEAPKRTWVHWVLYNIPADATGLEEDAERKGFPSGTLAGPNDFKKKGWGGPCPPIGKHRYFFKLYALDVVLTERGDLDKAKLLRAMEGHILEQTEIMGTYQKRSP